MGTKVFLLVGLQRKILNSIFFYLLLISCFQVTKAFGDINPNWDRDFIVPKDGRSNPYEINDPTLLNDTIVKGKFHALNWPVEPSGLILPYKPFKQLFDSKGGSLLKQWASGFVRGVTGVQSWDEFMEWVGLHPHPKYSKSWYDFPDYPNEYPLERLGVSIRTTELGTGFTLSCATCHVGQLFGKPVFGLTNRFPRANEFFQKGIRSIKGISPNVFAKVTDATDGEKEMYQKARDRSKFVGVVKPIALGLDTSLAQVSISLAHRKLDDYATMDPAVAMEPRDEKLQYIPADSKPAVWWNLKYKNKWLSDGSVVSGSPVFTNFLWNEIGRATDLNELDHWFKTNEAYQKVKELTTAVFAAEAPKITEFFSSEKIDLNSAKRGEVLFEQSCAKCHGSYKKNWNLEDLSSFTNAQLLETYRVEYPQPTKVINVGTDPYRRNGMTSLTQLNELSISKSHGMLIEVQNGYVPPPLVGIWARWPYFHNNSIPNLCVLMTPEHLRPKYFWTGEANDPNTDFDWDCVGYPIGKDTPKEWMTDLEHYFNTKKTGLSNQGHSNKILMVDGKEKFSASQKKDIIEFLKTL